MLFVENTFFWPRRQSKFLFRADRKKQTIDCSSQSEELGKSHQQREFRPSGIIVSTMWTE